MKKQSMAKGFAILSISTLIVKVFSIAYTPILNRIIGEEGMGVYGITFTVFACVFTIVNAGIPISISKLVSEYNAKYSEMDVKRTFIISRNLMFIISLILSLLLFLLSKPIAHFMGSESAALPIAIISPCVFFAAMSYVYRAYFQGMSNMVPSAVSSVCEQIINVLLSLTGAFILMRFGIAWGVVGGTIGTTVGAIFSYLYLYHYKNNKLKNVSQIKKEPVRKRQSREKTILIFKRIVRVALPLMICMGIMYFGDSVLDAANINSRLEASGYDQEEVTRLYGRFFKTTQFMNVPVSLITALSSSTLPSISALMVFGKEREIASKIKYAFKLCFLIVMPFAFAFSALSKSIYMLFNYAMFELLMYGACILIFMSLTQLQISILQSMGKLYQMTAFAVIGLICKFVINYICVGNKSLNISGALIGLGAGSFITFLLNHLYLQNTLRMRFSLLRLSRKPLAASLFMGIVGYVSNKLIIEILSLIGLGDYISNAFALVISGLACIFVFVATMYVIGGFEKDDLDLLPSRLVSKIPKKILNRIIAQA